MAATRKNTGGAKTEQNEQKFRKEQILASNRYYNRHDAINAIWADDSMKSIKEIDDMIENFMKG